MSRLKAHLTMIVQRMLLVAFAALCGAMAGVFFGVPITLILLALLDREDQVAPYYITSAILGALWGIAHLLDTIAPIRTRR